MYRFGFVLFILIQSGVLGAQSPHFKNISIEEGLTSSECYKVLQDHQGYIWISTDAGLCKYNGRQFKVFTIKDGLPSNTMFEITEDQYGRLWGACFNNEIFYVYNDSVYTIEANEELKKRNGPIKDIIIKLIVDESGVLHVGTTLNYYTISPAGNYAFVNAEHNEAFDSSAYYLNSVNDQAFFCGIERKNKYPQTRRTIYVNDRCSQFSLEILPNSNVWGYYAIKEDKDAYFFSFSRYLLYYKNGINQKKKFKNIIITLYQDRKKNLWIGFHRQGFLMFPRSDLSSPPIVGAEGESVSSFFEDREGAMWITTISNGIYYCSNPEIIYYDEVLNKKLIGLGMLDSQVFISTKTNVIYQIDSSGLHEVLDLSQYYQPERAYFKAIRGVNYKTGGLAFTFDRSGNYQLMNVRYSISQMEEVEGDVWGVNRDLLIRFNHRNEGSSYSLPSRGFCLLYTGQKELLVGCLNGLYIFKNGNFSKIFLGNGVDDCRIACLEEDEEGNLIVGTKGHGIFVRKKNKWLNLNEKTGLASNDCNDVFCSGNNYYIATNKGYTIISKTKGIQITNIDLSNGIPSNEVNKVAQYGDRVYVITEKGVCSYPANINIHNSAACELVVNQILISNKNLISNKTYPFYQNDLFFSCDVMSYKKPSQNKIKYQLVPVDKAARYSSVFEINYDNLAPGNYTLFIQGVNNNGVEGRMTVYHFVIKSPFWSTWWFITTSIIILSLSIYLLVRKRIRYIRKKESEKNMLKEKIVEFHYMALRAQMNPHFIFNVINSIQLYVLQNQPKEAYYYLSKFSKLIRRVLQNSKEKLITLADELDMIRLYLDLEKIRLEDHVEFEIVLAEGMQENKVFVPSMIIQPLLENAIWHGIVPLNGARPGKVCLKISQRENMLLISIKDNGVGMREGGKKIEKTSMGLDLIKDRLALLSNGSKFKVVHLVNDNNEIQGTEVIISFPIITKP